MKRVKMSNCDRNMNVLPRLGALRMLQPDPDVFPSRNIRLKLTHTKASRAWEIHMAVEVSEWSSNAATPGIWSPVFTPSTQCTWKQEYKEDMQSMAFKMLRTRLKTVPSHTLKDEQLNRASSRNPCSEVLQASHDPKNWEAGLGFVGIDFASKLQQFENMQQQHRMFARSQLQSRNKTSSPLSQWPSSPQSQQKFQCMFYMAL
ncbi:hypothetical protein Taro_018653 [Colocasia esculenta]|uniref:Uncharacterized protein n=1 Tax=Colocasia esculenta TaxID=4460 RepID=A0A843V337_COLES|nr:hypothetical protein [Colocasia esculenta]